MIFSRCGTHLHPTMESHGGDSGLLGAGRGVHMGQCAAISGGGVRVGIGKDMGMVACCSHVP